MKIRKTVKKLILLALVGCMAFSNIAYAEGPAEIGTRTVDAMYLLSGSIHIVRCSGEVNVEVITTANTNVDYIYHDISIYKNGVRVSYDRYLAQNDHSIATNIRVPAQSGDYFEVLVDHYTDHMGCLEVKYSSCDMTY